MKDYLSLIAAAAGGFMLSIAASSIINAAPVTSLKSLPSVGTFHTTSLQHSADRRESASCSLNDRNN